MALSLDFIGNILRRGKITQMQEKGTDLIHTALTIEETRVKESNETVSPLLIKLYMTVYTMHRDRKLDDLALAYGMKVFDMMNTLAKPEPSFDEMELVENGDFETLALELAGLLLKNNQLREAVQVMAQGLKLARKKRRHKPDQEAMERLRQRITETTEKLMHQQKK